VASAVKVQEAMTREVLRKFMEEKRLGIRVGG
jgi:hypothetical protein